MDFYIGQIITFGGDFTIRNMAICGGQMISISSNTALYSIIGNYYGGDARTTFALPNLRGRSPKGAGQGPATSDYPLGALTGFEMQTLTVLEMPTHTHAASTSNMAINVSTNEAQEHVPTSQSMLAAPGYTKGPVSQKVDAYASDISAVTPLSPLSITGDVAIGQAGGGQPFSILNPTQAVNFEMVLFGIYPPRD